MKDILKRLINFILVAFSLLLLFFMIVEGGVKTEVFLITAMIFFGIIGGLNYILFGKFRIWNSYENNTDPK